MKIINRYIIIDKIERVTIRILSSPPGAADSLHRLSAERRNAASGKRRTESMTITKTLDGTNLTIALEGRLDTTTSPQLEGEMHPDIDSATEVTFDLENLAYISSAGLRVLLSAQKIMNKQGKMTIKNVCPEIMDIFDVTGFVDILNIEN